MFQQSFGFCELLQKAIFLMNSQSDPTSVKFSCGGGLVPVGRRIVSLLGRWYYGLSTAFNNIFLPKSHVYLSLLQPGSF